MKIAYIYDTIYPFTFGGAEKRLWDLSKNLTHQGHEVHIFGPKYWKGPVIIKKEGIFYHGVCAPFSKRFNNGRRSIYGPIYFALKVFPALLKDSFDIIDCQEFPYFPCFAAKVCSLIRNKPMIITFHECWGSYWYSYLGTLKGLFGRIIELGVTKLGVKYIAISKTVKDNLMNMGLKENEIYLIPNGVEFEKIKRIPPNREKSDVIYVGRLAENKNIDILIKAVKIITFKRQNFKCAIIGDGPERQNLVRLTSELNIQGNVKFLGFLKSEDKVFSYIKASKVFVLPSTREGFSNVVLEANACGLPVIVVRNENNASTSLIAAGKNGFIVELNSEIFAKTIESLIENPVALERMSMEAQSFSSNYDWKRIASKFEAVYLQNIQK